MNNIQELKIIVIGRRQVGKTSLLAAMHEEFGNTFQQGGLDAKADDTRTLRDIEECKNVLKHIDPRLKIGAMATQPKEDPWQQHDFVFDIGREGKTFLKLRFSDPAGEYFNTGVTAKVKKYVEQQLKECDALIIPIDTTALMQKKTGVVGINEIGEWHEEFNIPNRITELLRNAYTGLTSPRLIILAPIKCESYRQTARDAENLLYNVRLGYRKLLDLLSSDELFQKVAVVITPVETIGNVSFAYHTTNKDGVTKFEYHKTPINADYAPKYGDQPIRYILLFLINLYLQEKKQSLQEQQNYLQTNQNKLNSSQTELQQVREDFEIKKELWEQRNNTWFLWRSIANLFDDRETPYNNVKSKLDKHEEEVDKVQKNVNSHQEKITATEEQINTFSHALQKFAERCKGKDDDSDGFAIIQGRKWFRTQK